MYFFGIACPRDAQRDTSKQAKKRRGVLDGEQVILCHTERVFRWCLPHLRGLSALDIRSASADREEKDNDRRFYEHK